jgi:hypothetical protein
MDQGCSLPFGQSAEGAFQPYVVLALPIVIIVTRFSALVTCNIEFLGLRPGLS